MKQTKENSEQIKISQYPSDLALETDICVKEHFVLGYIQFF